MADLTTHAERTAIEPPAVVVATADSLAADAVWTNHPNVFCDQLAIDCNGTDTVTLSYQFGDQVRHFDGTEGPFEPLDFSDKYVRLTIATNPVTIWYGLFVSDEIDRLTARDNNGTMRLAGRSQRLVCQGLEYLLDRVEVTSAVTFPDKRIQRPFTFNGGSNSPFNTGEDRRGNRQIALDPDGVPVFEKGLSHATEWTAADMVDYLLAHHPPRDNADAVAPLPWKLSATDRVILEGSRPEVATAGRTVREVLNSIIDPRRGYCWWLEYEIEPLPTPTAQITLRVASLASSAISLTDGVSLPANVNKLSIDADGDTTAAVTLKRYSQRRYHRVCYRGARMTSTFTAGRQDATLVEGFTAATEAAYKAGDSAATDYAALSIADKIKRNDAARRNPKVESAYAEYRLPADWDLLSGDGATATKSEAFPVLSPTGSVLGSLDVVVNGLRPLRRTRLRKGWDYATGTPSGDTTGDAPDAYLSIFAVVQTDVGPPESVQRVDRLSDAPRGGPYTSYDLYPADKTPGVRLRSRRGLPHTLAKGRFDDAEPSAVETEISPDTLRVTMTVESDAYSEGVWPDTTPAGVPVEELVIKAGDEYRLDFLAASTVVAIEEGYPVTRQNALVLRDDRQRLRDLARLAYEWYQQPRSELTLSLNGVRQVADATNRLGLGTMVTTLGEGATQADINGVVASIAYDFVGRQTTIRTFGEQFDIRSLLA